MGYDPYGNWNWGLFWEIIANVVSVAIGVIVGSCVAVTTGNPVLALETGVATAGAVNNAIDFAYYTFISDGTSDLTPTSYSGTNGDSVKYLSRWDRLDYTKSMTKDSWYNLNAWRDIMANIVSICMLGWRRLHFLRKIKEMDFCLILPIVLLKLM